MYFGGEQGHICILYFFHDNIYVCQLRPRGRVLLGGDGGYIPTCGGVVVSSRNDIINAPRATIGRQNALTAVKLSKAAQKLRHSTRIGRHVPLTSPKDLEVAIFVKKSAQSMQTSPKTLKVAIFQEVYNGLKSKKLHILLYKIAQYLREDCTFMGGNV